MKLYRLLAAFTLLTRSAAPGQPQPGLRLWGDGGARIAWLHIFASRGDDWINDTLIVDAVIAVAGKAAPC